MSSIFASNLIFYANSWYLFNSRHNKSCRSAKRFRSISKVESYNGETGSQRTRCTLSTLIHVLDADASTKGCSSYFRNLFSFSTRRSSDLNYASLDYEREHK